ncbi:hypothetical protein QJS04_geneDACA012761 [Acorus gramineus]|uniref:Neprosin PEP catalytic domain-containing protein n=1 Tax=Acorus gramineus TaxID=55184 RepID=A0AAV9A2A6_ACOGR|nr:hypothetical protein QJS04_geneDACA012761 [Acorus gramineus]
MKDEPRLVYILQKGGDIIDCIDIKKQPAFDHPLLRNHKLQVNLLSSSFLFQSGNIGCPSGTVPILRTTKEDLVRARSISNSINGDAKTRFFTFWTSNGYKQGCHNLQCPGFVQVSTKVHPGAVVSPLSEFFFKFQDRSSGNWWLYYGNEKEPVGYWPKSLFTSLANSASEVRWGGNVVSPTSEPSPPMGSGHFSQEGDSRACYFMNMKNLDAGYAMSGPDVWNTEKQSDLPGFYGEGQLLIEGQPRGHVYSFGGPGGYKQG